MQRPRPLTTISKPTHLSKTIRPCAHLRDPLLQQMLMLLLMLMQAIQEKECKMPPQQPRWPTKDLLSIRI